MLEIFIPLTVKTNNLEINNVSKLFLDTLKNNFSSLELIDFESKYINWLKLQINKFDNDLVILCNWEFGEDYFINYDLIDNPNIITFWTKFIWINDLSKKIEKIDLKISEIIDFLNSNKLLTNSKKQEILEKIKYSFFSLSWILFLLYSLKEKSDENIKQLSDYSWKIEYEAQAKLLSETSKLKSIELNETIVKLEEKVKLFIEVISKFI